jgi:hypothetical protein
MAQKARMLTVCNDPRASARHRPAQRRYLPLRNTRHSVFNFAIAIHRGRKGGGGPPVLLHHLERKFRARQKDRERGLLLFSHRTTPRIGSAPPRSRSGGPPQGGSLNPLHQPSQAARRPCKDTTASPAHTHFRTRTQAEYIIDAHPTRVETLRLWTRLPSPSTQPYAYCELHNNGPFFCI